MDFWFLRFLCWFQFLRGLRLGPPSDANGDGLLLNYDLEIELCEQSCLTQPNGNEHYAGAKIISRGDYAEYMGGNGKRVATGIGFQVPR